MTAATPWVEISVALVALYVLRALVSKRSHPYPPGPRGLPLVGNLPQWPKDKEWETFSRWAHDYGDIVHVKLASQHVVIVNDAALCIQLMEGKGNIYSDRPSRHFACDIVGWKKFLTMSKPDDWFKGQRRLITRNIGTKATIGPTEGMQQVENMRFLRRVLDEPERLAYHVRKMAGAVILNISHGYQVTEGDDDIVILADKLLHEFSELLAPGAFLVDSLPFLDYLPSWFPGTGYRKVGAEYRTTLEAFLKRPHNFVRQQLNAGTARPSFVGNLIDTPDLTPEQDELIQWTAAVLFGGGADTGVAITLYFILAMMRFPELQAKAQAELDAVVGRERMPTMADRAHLPYTEALLKEVWRFCVIGPQGSPHALAEDDVVTTAEGKQFFMPKGTIVVPHVWCFMKDEKVYPNADVFNPDRFLGPNPQQDPRTYTFGFGRRRCPGEALADMSFWMTCVMFLATFDAQKPKDAELDLEPLGVLILHPKEFAINLKPRSRQMEDIIRATPEAPSMDAEAFAKVGV